MRFGDGERDWDSLRHGMGRNELPGLLSLVWAGLPRELLIKALGDSWVMCEYPEQVMPRREWLPIFRSACYHDEESPAAAPDRITLWRGGDTQVRHVVDRRPGARRIVPASIRSPRHGGEALDHHGRA